MKTTRLLSFSKAIPLVLVASLPAFGADITQVSNNGSGQSWANAATWSNNAAASSGNDYFTDGFSLRTVDAATGTSTFAGASLTVAGGTNGIRGTLSMKAGTTNITNLLLGVGTVTNAVNNGVSNIAATLNVTNLTVLSAATSTNAAILQGSNSGNNLAVNATNLLGTGFLQFTGNRNYSLSVANASAFTGTLRLNQGNLTLAADLNLNGATFTMANSGATLILDNNLVVSSFSFGTTQLGEGIYTSSQLNTFFSTSAFSGAGNLQVAAVPEPATYTAVLGGLALSAVMLTRRRSR